MKGNFYRLEYIPNKMAYVYETTKKEIKFLAFLKEKDSIFKAIPHSVSIKLKRDFVKPKNCYVPHEEIKTLIKNFLDHGTIK
jgi:hypothetical protein